jgi:ankyrin repeat protein
VLQIVFVVLQDDLTPLLLALRENKQQMVEYLVRKKADIHAIDKLGRYRNFILFF